MVNDKEGGSLGSDGETSDYQRSTPSPQDSNARITELSEGNNTNSETLIIKHQPLDQSLLTLDVD